MRVQFACLCAATGLTSAFVPLGSSVALRPGALPRPVSGDMKMLGYTLPLPPAMPNGNSPANAVESRNNIAPKYSVSADVIQGSVPVVSVARDSCSCTFQ